MVVRRLSAASEEGLAAATKPWTDDGYLAVAYEVIPLPLEGLGP